MSMRSAVVMAITIAVSGLAFAGGDHSTADKIKMLDTDGDGQVSTAEFVAKSGKTQADFDGIDTNKDGQATTAEMDAHMAMNKGSRMDKPMKSDAMKSDDMKSDDMKSDDMKPEKTTP